MSDAEMTALQMSILRYLARIEEVLGHQYTLTLLATYHGPKQLKDADMMMTRDTRENMMRVIDRFYPQSVQNSEPAKPI